MPIAVALTALSLYRAPFSKAWCLLLAIGLYAAAKGTEVFDAAIHRGSDGLVSGHTLKHLLAAGATLAILEMLRRRAPRAATGV
jgi:hypothetical protein